MPGPNTPVGSYSFERPLGDQEPRLDARDASLRSLIVEAALKVVDMDGLTLQPDSITYAAVFRHLKEEYGITVTRASVHERIWATTRDFRLDVLREIVRMENFDINGLYDQALTVLKDLPPELVGSDRTTEATRLWTNELSDAGLGSTTKLISAVLAALLDRSDDETSTEVLRHYDKRASEAIDRKSKMCGQILQRLDLVPKPELAMPSSEVTRVFSVCLTSLMVGYAIDRSAGNHFLDAEIDLPSAGTNDRVRWSPLAITTRAVSNLLFEQVGEAPNVGRHPPPSEERILDLRESDSQQDTKHDHRELGLLSSTRRTRSQLRKLVLDAALEVSDRDGFRLRSDSISYKRVFDQIEQDHGFVVNRSSVHKRMWASHDDFRFDVLTTAVGRTPRAAELSAELMRVVEPTMNGDGSMKVRQTVYDTIRAASEPIEVAVSGPAHLFRWHLIKSAIIGERTESNAARLRQSIDLAYRQLLDESKCLLIEPLKRFGVEVREEHGMDWDEVSMLFVVLLAPANFSIDFATLSTSNARALTVPIRRIDGTDKIDNWSLKALVVRSLVDHFFAYPD